MPDKRTDRRCVFCGEQASSREHVFPLWLSRLVGDAGDAPFTLNNPHGRNKKGLRTFGVFTWDACAICNNGWMSTLEDAAKPLLSPAVRGEAISWGSDEQLTVAAWAHKTALMLD